LSGRDVDYAILRANGVLEKDVSTASNITENPKLDLSSIIEAKVGKLVRQKLQNY
jgi:hypothetical protein